MPMPEAILKHRIRTASGAAPIGFRGSERKYKPTPAKLRWATAPNKNGSLTNSKFDKTKPIRRKSLSTILVPPIYALVVFEEVKMNNRTQFPVTPCCPYLSDEFSTSLPSPRERGRG